jgi:membrane-bound lytic murein transglycosylase D
MILRTLMLGVLTLFWAQSSMAQNGPKSTIPAQQLKDFANASLFADEKNVSYRIPDVRTAFKYDSLWLEELVKARELFAVRASNVEGPVDKEIPAEVLKERLFTLNQKTPFDLVYSPILEREIASFLRGEATLIRKMIDLSAFYFPLFEEELDKANLPLEIKYLAIVESALDPRAESYVGAKGLWQFMYATAKMFGLEINNYVDERMSPTKSTQAAVAYLKQLYGIFGNWDLALAAYNSGPGNVSKAIRRSGGYTNYWNIRPYLPKETADYVPRFYAVMYLFEHAEAHNLGVSSAKRTYFETDTIHVKETVTFEQLSKRLPLSEEQLSILNPEYKSKIVPYEQNKERPLRLPKAAMGLFLSAEADLYAEAKKMRENKEQPLLELINAPERVQYSVQPGDALSLIARRYGVQVSQIKTWNNLKDNTIRVGQRLTVYPKRYPRS